MSPPRMPPPEVQRAAVQVRVYLDAQDAAKTPRRDMMRQWAERLDRAHQVDQSRMPEWRDPRKG